MGADESLVKYEEGKRTSGLCFSTLAQDKGVGDERCDLPLTTCSWCWAAAGSGVALQSFLQAGLQNRESAVTGKATMCRQFIFIFKYVSLHKHKAHAFQKRRCCSHLLAGGWVSCVVWVFFHWCAESWWRVLSWMFWKNQVYAYTVLIHYIHT